MSDEDGAKVGLLNRNLIRIRSYLKDGYSIGEIAHKMKLPVSEISKYIKLIEEKKRKG